MVWGVREVLWLQAEACVLLISDTSFTHQTAIEKIAGVKLNARLSRQDFKHTAGGRFLKVAPQVSMNHPSRSRRNCDRIHDFGSYTSALPEIHQRPIHRFDLTSRNQIARDRSKTIGI